MKNYYKLFINIILFLNLISRPYKNIKMLARSSSSVLFPWKGLLERWASDLAKFCCHKRSVTSYWNTIFSLGLAGSPDNIGSCKLASCEDRDTGSRDLHTAGRLNNITCPDTHITCKISEPIAYGELKRKQIGRIFPDVVSLRLISEQLLYKINKSNQLFTHK